MRTTTTPTTTDRLLRAGVHRRVPRIAAVVRVVAAALVVLWSVWPGAQRLRSSS